jgi:plastocyanin
MLDGWFGSAPAVARAEGRRRRGALPRVLTAVALSVAPASAADISGRVVDAAGAPLAAAVVFVQAPAPASPPGAGKTAVIDQVDKQFVPHVLPVAVGTAVSFPNHDQIHHHVYSFSPAKTFEIPLYKGEQASPVTFDAPGAVKLGCNIHDWMSGIILVVPTAFFASTDAGGGFTLRDLPPGPLTLVAWHEASRTPVDATAQQLEGAPDGPLTFTLDTAPRRPRRGGGGRSYE